MGKELSLNNRRGPSGDRPARVAVIGCGYWGKNLVRNFAELDALGAICDLDRAAATRLAEQYQSVVADVEAVLGDPDIAGVAIAAPAVLHAGLARQAIEAGKHVFVEKPLALTVPEAEALCGLAEGRDRRLMVGHLMQYHPGFEKLLGLVREGALGRLQYIYSNRLNLGKVRREEDILWSFAPHDLSMILSLVGQEPSEVTAQGGYYLHKSIADVTTTSLAFPGGEQAHVFVSWLHPFKEQKLVAIGDRAMAVLDDGQPWRRKLVLYPHRIEWRDAMPVPQRAEADAVRSRRGRAAQARMPAFPRLHRDRRHAAHRRPRRAAGAARAGTGERGIAGAAGGPGIGASGSCRMPTCRSMNRLMSTSPARSAPAPASGISPTSCRAPGSAGTARSGRM